MNKPKDPRIELAIAYREAGLDDKANELLAEMVREKTGGDFGAAKLAAARDDLDKAYDVMAKLADKLGIPRPTRPKRRPPRR